MTLQTLHDTWETDGMLPADELDVKSLEVPTMHGKWWKIYTALRIQLKKLDTEYAILYKRKYEWYLGKMDDAERKALGWDIQPLKILKDSLPVYMNADADIIEVTSKRHLVEEMLRFVESVIKEIQNRGFHIKNHIDYLKWKMGQ